MKDLSHKLRVALVQATPVMFNKDATIDKVCAQIREAGANGADLNEAFQFTSDQTGLIGIHETPDYTNMTASDTVVSGIVLFAERIDGVVVGTISGATGA